MHVAFLMERSHRACCPGSSALLHDRHVSLPAPSQHSRITPDPPLPLGARSTRSRPGRGFLGDRELPLPRQEGGAMADVAGPSKSADKRGLPHLATAEETLSSAKSANGLRRRERSFEAPWVAGINSTADRLDGELKRVPGNGPDYQVAAEAIALARHLAERPSLLVDDRLRLRGLRRLWKRVGSWWAGTDVDQAWSAIHTAGEALLGIESPESLRSQIGDMAATLVTTLTSDDLRTSSYLATLDLLTDPQHEISDEDRAQLRAIRNACDSSSGERAC